MVGYNGLTEYIALLQSFGGTIGFEGSRAAKYIDLGAFVRLLFHVDLGMAPLVFALPFAYLFRDDPWSAVPATLLLNSYAPIYDLVLLVPIFIAFGRLGPVTSALFLLSLIAVPVAQLTGFQLMTPLLISVVWQARQRHTVYAMLRA